MESARSFSVGSCRPQLGAVWLLFLILLHSHLIWELWDFELHTDEWRKLVPLFPSWVHKECSDQCYRFATYSLYLCWHVFHLLLVPSILFFFFSMKHIKPSGVFLYQGEHVYLCDWSYLLVWICGTNLGSLGWNQLVMMFSIFFCFFVFFLS